MITRDASRMTHNYLTMLTHGLSSHDIRSPGPAAATRPPSRHCPFEHTRPLLLSDIASMIGVLPGAPASSRPQRATIRPASSALWPATVRDLFQSSIRRFRDPGQLVVDLFDVKRIFPVLPPTRRPRFLADHLAPVTRDAPLCSPLCTHIFSRAPSCTER